MRPAAHKALQTFTNIRDSDSEGDTLSYQTDSEGEENFTNGLESEDSSESDTDISESQPIVQTQAPTSAETLSEGVYISKCQMYNWETPGTTRTGPTNAHNVFKVSPGVTNWAKANIVENDPFSCFELIFDRTICLKVLESTTKQAREHIPNWNLTQEELLSFIGLLFIRGAASGSKLDLDSFWLEKWGMPIFRQTMARNKFREIMRFLRFDDKSSRRHRLATDKFCMISEIWGRFVENCQSAYKPSENLTIDEQLLPSKARCPFTQYMPCKPDKFGINTGCSVKIQRNMF